MNQATKEALAILARQLLITAGTALGISGVLTPYIGVLTNLMVSAFIILGAAAWSQMAQLFKRGKLMQALQEAGMTEVRMENMVRSALIPTPSVMTPKTVVPSTAPPPNPRMYGH